MAGFGSFNQLWMFQRPLQLQGFLIFRLGGCRVQPTAELDEFMVRSLNALKEVMRLIIGFIAVDTCVKHPFLAKLCCY